MKKLLFFIFVLNNIASANVHASEFQLGKISREEFIVETSKISNQIAPDDTKKEVLPFDIKQSFTVLKSGVKIGYFVPVKFNSRQYKNTICSLYYLDIHHNIDYVDLFSEKNDGEDIVTSCIGVEAISIKENSVNSVDCYAVVRVRLANQYKSTGVIIHFNGKKLSYDDKVNSCIQAGKPVSNISDIKNKIQFCAKTK